MFCMNMGVDFDPSVAFTGKELIMFNHRDDRMLWFLCVQLELVVLIFRQNQPTNSGKVPFGTSSGMRSSGRQQRSMLWRWLTAPHRALRRARVMYERGMVGCASGAAARVAVPRSRTHHGFRTAATQPPCSRDDDDDAAARELIRAAAKATEGEDGRGVVAPPPRRNQSAVAAMMRIDEYGPCSFERIM
ncbi:uncharacterized protein LOC122037005 isoform X1 [Zingiber officinale]|uniref:uncharacterized protein LOC122037005 isoform X1 n=1 Tax=Zingiber officinale TaxID=94328 RepID=UPI001C4CF6F8|nr:uncharacterized protein LOC122037005 isoform X1 [Zingiber officinale]